MILRKPIAPGQIFFRLTVISEAPNKKGSNGIIYCVKAKCECGNEIIVPEYKLRAKHTKSCGCLQIEMATKNLPKEKHGHSSLKNHKYVTREYKTWLGMKQRCETKDGFIFKHYGARGIKVCERWVNNFENFLSDMGMHPGEGYSLDRIDANGNYEPSNCRWANWNTQARNRRNNKNVLIDNKEYCVSEACIILNVHQSKIIRMVKKLNITHQQAVNLLLLKPQPVNMRQFKEKLHLIL